MEVSFNQDRGYVWIRLEGKQTLETLQRAYYKLLKMPEHRPGMSRVWDIRRADLSEMSADDLRQLGGTSRGLESNTRKIKVAVLVGRDLEFGFMRMLQALGGESMPIEVEVFRSAKKAKAWISRPWSISE